MHNQIITVHRIVRDLLQIGAFLQKTGNRITKKFGLTQQQFTVLYEIGGNDAINQTHLVGALLLEKSNVSKIVNFLQHNGLIRVDVNAADARATILSITEKGRAVMEDCMTALNAWNQTWLEPLKAREVEAAGDIVATLKGLILST